MALSHVCVPPCHVLWPDEGGVANLSALEKLVFVHHNYQDTNSPVPAKTPPGYPSVVTPSPDPSSLATTCVSYITTVLFFRGCPVRGLTQLPNSEAGFVCSA